MKLLSVWLLVLGAVLSGASLTKFAYNLQQPSIVRQLPEILNEISGLTDIDSTHVACVQDELGIVFIYDFVKGKIVAQYRFDNTGDFEGLTYAHKTLYILRSDGRLTEWVNFRTGNSTVNHYQLPLVTSNNEGLCYDAANNQLLIAAKSKPLNHDEKSERYIYAYNIATQKLHAKPLYSISVEQLKTAAARFNIQPTDTNAKGVVKPFNFRPSSLSVHPITNDIYIISAADKLLIVMDREGTVKHVQSLTADLFSKAEGITFLSNGTMIITNEAAGKIPTLLVFKATPGHFK